MVVAHVALHAVARKRHADAQRNVGPSFSRSLGLSMLSEFGRPLASGAETPCSSQALFERCLDVLPKPRSQCPAPVRPAPPAAAVKGTARADRFGRCLAGALPGTVLTRSLADVAAADPCSERRFCARPAHLARPARASAKVASEITRGPQCAERGARGASLLRNEKSSCFRERGWMVYGSVRGIGRWLATPVECSI